MVADSSDQQHPDHLLDNLGKKVLRATAIYGANAAGKSNLIKALTFAQNRVIEGSRGDQTIPVMPFRLGTANRDRPSGFEFIFQHQGVIYSYGFRLDSHRIVEEWLSITSQTPHPWKSSLFERTTSTDGETNIEFGTRFYRGNKQKQFLEFVAQGTRRNQLFLTEAFDRNVAEVRPVVEWFQDVLLLIPAESKHANLEINTHVKTTFTQFIGNFLREAGTGIENFLPKEVSVNVDSTFADMPEQIRERLRQGFAELKQDEVMDFHTLDGKRWLLTRNKANEIVQLQLRTIHRTRNGKEVEFSLEEESDGTQRLTHLIPLLFSMHNQNKVVIVDELDRRLHPLLCRKFVETALQCNGETGFSQMVFTTHDTNLLALDLLRRDEIRFVEKDEGGASRMYSLAEFNIRLDLKVSKSYLNGRFGAIPFLGDICQLGWAEKAKAVGDPVG